MSHIRYWWLGLPFATLHVNIRKNTGTKTSPFEFIFGHEGGTRGVGELQIPKHILKKLLTESDLNLHFKLAEGQLFEWIGRPSPPVESIDKHDKDCEVIKHGDVIQMGQTSNPSEDDSCTNGKDDVVGERKEASDMIAEHEND